MRFSANDHACDLPDLVYKFWEPPREQRNGELLFGAIRCNECPRRWHLTQRPGWKSAYWSMNPPGPMPGAVGPAVYLAGLKPYEPTEDELDQAAQERERRRIIRAEADLVLQRRRDDWREWDRLRQTIHPRQFRVKIRRRPNSQHR